jgi:tRNA threonylcarbamoyl adenosine modification protein (Sua5/YciO/YrdC/YwlC family)
MIKDNATYVIIPCMTQLLTVHPTHPQKRLLSLAADEIRRGVLVVYPTDTTYALGCHIGDKGALERIIRLRRLGDRHQFTLMCRDLSDLGTYARVDNASYRLLRRYTPGPFTFVLQATREVPRRLVHPKRRSIGLRVPSNQIARDLLEVLQEPIMTSTLRLPGDEDPMQEAAEILERVNSQVDVVIDGGMCGLEPSTIVDLTGGGAHVIRQGVGIFE